MDIVVSVMMFVEFEKNFNMELGKMFVGRVKVGEMFLVLISLFMFVMVMVFEVV